MNRSQRKRVARSLDKARKDLARSSGESVQDIGRSLELAQYVSTLEALVSKDSAGESAVKVVTELMANTERAQAESERFLDQAARKQVDCSIGCAWCCHEPLQVSVLDAVSVAHRLRETGAGSERLEQYCAKLESEIGYQRSRLKGCFWACPFLDVSQRLCSLYQARPVVCRAFHSLDVSTCERNIQQRLGVRGVPMYLQLMGFIGLPLEGAHRALKEISVDITPVVLGPAVALLLRDFEGVLEEWLAGKPAFEPVQVLAS